MAERTPGAAEPGRDAAHRDARRPADAPPLVLVDETLRDGLQSPSVKDPPLDAKKALLHAMAAIGVGVVSVGLPAVGGRAAEEARALVRTIAEAKLPLVPTAAARTVVGDVDAVADLAHDTGEVVEVYAFIGASPVRRLAEEWSVAFVLSAVRAAGSSARRHQLPFCLVLEDTTRTHPDLLRAIFAVALEEGAARICLCDTTGHATPHGARELVTFARRTLRDLGAPHERIGLDWHGHNDRGLALGTALAAAQAGVDRVHGTALGLGERVGNAPLELLATNLAPAQGRALDPALVRRYVGQASRALAAPIPPNHPFTAPSS